jgi:hypothetical protein
LTSITIPASVEVICQDCFESCKSLSTVTFEHDSQLKSIAGAAFMFSGIEVITIPPKVQTIVGICESLREIEFECGSQVIYFEVRAFRECRIATITIPASLICRGEYCFIKGEVRREVRFESGSNLQRIDRWAFMDSGLERIHIPASLQVLGPGCFERCKKLREVTFEENSQLTEIEPEVFLDSAVTWIELGPNCHMFTGESFLGLKGVVISKENRFLSSYDSLLPCFAGQRAIRYFV